MDLSAKKDSDQETSKDKITAQVIEELKNKIGDLEIYQEMRRKGEPSPLLRIAETWLRGELEQNDIVEAPAGKMAIEAQNPLANGYGSAGGFSAGRMGAYDYIG